MRDQSNLPPGVSVFDEHINPKDDEEERPKLYYCCVSTCPGYPYKASDVPHPCREAPEVEDGGEIEPYQYLPMHTAWMKKK